MDLTSINLDQHKILLSHLIRMIFVWGGRGVGLDPRESDRIWNRTDLADNYDDDDDDGDDDHDDKNGDDDVDDHTNTTTTTTTTTTTILLLLLIIIILLLLQLLLLLLLQLLLLLIILTIKIIINRLYRLVGECATFLLMVMLYGSSEVRIPGVELW